MYLAGGRTWQKKTLFGKGKEGKRREKRREGKARQDKDKQRKDVSNSIFFWSVLA